LKSISDFNAPYHLIYNWWECFRFDFFAESLTGWSYDYVKLQITEIWTWFTTETTTNLPATQFNWTTTTVISPINVNSLPYTASAFNIYPTWNTWSTFSFNLRRLQFYISPNITCWIHSIKVRKIVKKVWEGEVTDDREIKIKVDNNCTSSTPVVNWTCWDNAKTYSWSLTSYSSTWSFCGSWTVSPTTPDFPEEWQTINWTCNWSWWGSSQTCVSTREFLPYWGNYIIYRNNFDSDKLYKKNTSDNSNWSAITSVSSWDAKYSPDGISIVYLNGSNWYLYKKNANDNSNWSAITSVSSWYPSYSPDGNYIIYTNYDDWSKLYRKNANDNSNGIPITTRMGFEGSYSPDWNYIVYNWFWRLYIKNSNDVSDWNFINTVFSYTPLFSLDGRFIVYSNWEDGYKLYKKNVDDTLNWTGITTSYVWIPSYSSDWNYIYYSYWGGWYIYKKNANDDTNWYAVNSTSSFSPIQSPIISSLNWQCWTNAKNYTVSNKIYTWNFCLKWTPNDLHPAFPWQWQTVDWICMWSNWWQNVSCWATRDYYCPGTWTWSGVCNVPVYINNQVFSSLVAMHDSIDSNSIMYASNDNQNNTPWSTTDTNNWWDPVNLATWEFDYNNTLMSIPWVKLPYEFKLFYKNQTYYDWTVWINWDHNYNIYLVDEWNGNMLLYNWKLWVFRFLREWTWSTFAYNPWLRANLRKDDTSWLYTLNYDLWDKYSFNVFKKISQIQDRYWNHIDLSYDSSERLIQVTDTLWRNINYTYENFKIKEVTDFNWNKVTLSYYDGTSTWTTDSWSSYDLKEIKINNNWDEKTIKFEYSTWSNNSDKHNITKLFDSAWQVYVKNTYEYDRVKTQEYWNGTISYNYTLSWSQVIQNTVTDKVWNITDYFYDDKSNNIQTKYHVWSGTLNYSYTYNSDWYVLTQTSPKWNWTKFTYDERWNITQKRQKTDMSASDNDVNDIVAIYTYNERNQLLTQVTPTWILTTNQYDLFGNLLSTEISWITQSDWAKAWIKRSDWTTYSILTTFVHNSKGELTKSVDWNGHETRFTYSWWLLVSTSTWDWAATRTTTITYNSYWIPTSTTDARWNTSTYDITSFNQVWTWITAEWIIKSYKYDLNNNKTQEELILWSWETQTTNYTYDVLDELIQSSQEYDDNKNLVTNIKYDNNWNIIEKTTWSWAKITYEYNSFWKVTKQIVKVDENDSSKDLITTYTYDSNQNIIKKTNPRGKETTYTYDLFDRLKNETDPYRNYILYFYDKDSQIQEIRKYEFKPIPVLSSRTEYTYNWIWKLLTEKKYLDPNGNILSDGMITKTDYDKNGNIISKVDSNWNATTFTYDEFNNLLETRDSLGNKIINTYDKNNNLLTKTVKQSNNKTATTTYTYDKDNRVLSETNELNKTKTYTYNNLNQVISKIDEKWNIINYTYDYAWKIKTETKVIPSWNITTTYTYDERWNILSVTDWNSNTTNYEYDKLNRLLKQTYPNTKFITFTYDKNSNLVSKTDPNGTTVTNTYDDLDRLITKSINKWTWVEWVTSESYTYDNLWRLLNWTDSDTHALSFEYDALNRLTKETNNWKSVEYTYDLNSNLTKEKLWSSETTYSYDSLNRVTSIKKNNQNIADYTYTWLENTSISLWNSTNITKTYDELSRLSSLNNAIKTYTYTYDEVWNITSDSIKNYTYDEIYRLTWTNNTWWTLESLSYDKVWNRLNNYNSYIWSWANYEYSVNNLNQYTTLSWSILKYQLQEVIEEIDSGSWSETWSGETSSWTTSWSGSESWTWETNSWSTNSWTTNTWTTISYTWWMVNIDDSRNYTYDDNWNIINNWKYSFKYDYKNRLVRVENWSWTVISYWYDVMDRRYKKETWTKLIQYVYSNENVLEESTTSSWVTKVKEYINWLWTDNLIAYEIDSVRYYYSKNHLWSIDWISDNSWVKLISYEYDSYWNVFVNSSSWSLVDINDFTWSTYDNERLFTWREYDFEIWLYYMRARYYDSKIWRFISRDPIDIRDDVNLYSYVGNNPITYIDLNWTTKILILVWNPYDRSQMSWFNATIKYQVDEAIKNWVDPADIYVIHNIMSPEDFNKAVKKHLWNIKSVTYIWHWTASEAWGINKENVSKLESLKYDSNDNPLITLISCQTWEWENSIAQDISNQLWFTVSAPNNITTIYEEEDLKIRNIWDQRSLWGIEAWEPTVKNWWKYINFYPVY
jgi:RHS repeat-associated protein